MYGNGAKLNSSVLDAVTPQDAAIPIGSFLEIMSTEPGEYFFRCMSGKYETKVSI